MTHTDLLRQALDALELQEPAVGCPREREHWKRTAMPTMDALRAALAQPAPAVQVVLRQPNLFAADPAAPAVNCEWTNCPRRVGDVCCNDRPAAPAVPAVQIGMKASTWETLSSDAQTLILEAGQRAVDKAKAQRLADAAARGGMAQIPLDGSAAAPAVREPLEGAVDPDCNYIAPMGKVCNKCGRIHRGITGDGK